MNSSDVERNYKLEYLSGSNVKYYFNADVRIREAILRRVQGYLNRSHTCLEIGAYKGYMTKLISEFFNVIDVIEPVDDFNESLRTIKAVRSIFNTSLEKMELKQYDAIFLVNTLEHIDHRIQALSKIRSMLSPNGFFICAVPNAYALSRQIARSMGLLTHLTEVTTTELMMGHRVTYTPDSFRMDCESAGFKVHWAGGDLLKPLSNAQLDACFEQKIVNDDFFEGLYELGGRYPDMCASCILVLGH
jgi:SAM-dependent methyltransferase